MKQNLRRLRMRHLVALPSALILVLAGCGESLEVGIPPADAALAEPEGLAWWARSAINGYLDYSVSSGAKSGFVAMFARDGRIVHATVAGLADIENNIPMTLDTRFRMASMTKPVTAVAALILIEEGRLRLDDPVSRYIPEAALMRVATSDTRGQDGEIPSVLLEPELLVRNLIHFRSGIGSGGEESDLEQEWEKHNLYRGEGSLQERVVRLLEAPLYEQPGTAWRYGGSADVLARVIEVAAGESFDVFLQKRIFDPLKMGSTGFFPTASERKEMTRIYTQDENGDLILNEKPGYDTPTWTPGGSGLVSIASDYMRFALMLWNEGSYDGVQILKPETVRDMRTPHVESGVLLDEGIDGLGWGRGLAVVVDSEATLTIDRDGDFWWAGYYGTTFIVSPETGLVCVVLSQNEPGPHSGRPIEIFVAEGIAYYGL